MLCGGVSGRIAHPPQGNQKEDNNMALTEKEHAEIRRLTMLKMAVDNSPEGAASVTIIAKAKQFEEYVVGESDEKSGQS